ncbi:uncharacterized protein LOC100374707 [Saccoglossus kowalevskii]|uniref:Uncharacterized protein LOC100374707 n=1 Tax=Saccoglossus kowalevskii TaxID=10224 RepID=A0ABM0H0L3_SACKO|nr:PREDICTED: uncharacterized protein LOC100374707 [Saccoglossus kowalevskii]
MLQAFLFSLFHLYELFLASALTTQVAVSVAVVAVSSAVVYYCQHRGYANYISLGLLFGGWRAAGEPLDTGGGDNNDGGDVLKKYIGPGDGGGEGPYPSKEQEIAGAVRALISVVPGSEILESNVSGKSVMLSSDKQSKDIVHPSRSQRTFGPSEEVVERSKDFRPRTNIVYSGATKQHIHSDNVEYRWEKGASKQQSDCYNDRGYICERQKLEAHLQGKTLITEKRQEKSHECPASAQRNTSDLASNVTLTPTRSASSSKKEGTGTKPNHPNEEVKSLHRTTGRLNVRSSGQHNPHALIECSKHTAAKIDHKLRPVKSASEESSSKFESGIHTQKSDFSMGHPKPDVCRLLHDGIEFTDLTSTKQTDSPVISGVRRSSAPVPLIHIFKSDNQPETENEYDNTHRLSLSDTTLMHLPTVHQNVSLEVPMVYVGHHVSYSKPISETTHEENRSVQDDVSISTESRDGMETGIDSDSCVAEVKLEEMFTGPPVSTEQVYVSKMPVPSVVITPPDTKSDDEMNKVPEQVSIKANDSLGVPNVCMSELVAAKSTQCIYLTTQTQDDIRTSSVLTSMIVPEIRTMEVGEPAPVCAKKNNELESNINSEQFTSSCLISYECLGVPSINTVKESYPQKEERRPPDIEMSFPPPRPILKHEAAPPSPTSPTKRKSVKFSQSVVGVDDDGDDGDNEYCFDNVYSLSEQEHIKRPRLQRDYGFDIPDLNGSEKIHLQRSKREMATIPATIVDVKTRFTQSSAKEAMLFFTEKTLGSSDSSDSSDKPDFIFGQKSDITFEKRVVNNKTGGANECNQAAVKNGAKSRFLEVTQNEGRSHFLLTTTITTSTSSESNGSEDNGTIETEDAKSRFLQSSDAAKSSLLLSKTITGSVESSSDDTTVCIPMPVLQEAEQNVPTSSAQDAEDQSDRLDVDGESAKSRFLESCSEPETVDREEYLDVQRSDGYGERETRKPSRWDSEANAAWHKALQDELSVDIEFYESDDDEEKESEKRSDRRLKDSPSDGSISDRTHRIAEADTDKIDCFSPWYNKAVVLDNGSDVLKVGLAGDYLPSASIPTLVGRIRDSVESASSKETNTFVGDDALANQGILSFDYPVEDGIIDNWSDMERIWDHVFTYELDLSPSEHPVLITEIATAPREQRQKYLEVMFERFHVPAVFLSNQAVLSLHASGHTSGVVLSSGSGVTELVPIYEGFALSHAVSVLDIAGREVTRQLARLLQCERGYNFTTSSEWEILRIMKERLSYVALDCENEKRRAKVVEAHEYKLPDGQTMKVSNELFQCTESLFDPSIVGITHQSGIHMLVKESLQRCDPEIRALLKDMLLLSGGNTKLKGFLPRLQKELRGLNLNMSVSAPTERDNSAWIGGSILASHSSFMDRWVTVDEYADQGEQIVHRKCF